MPSDTPTEPRDVAVDQLRELGLSAYAARTFVALARLGEATAKEVSQVSEVPRTRVYGAAEELQDRGLVDVQHSTPRRFWAVSTETATTRFTREYAHHVSVLTEALDALDTLDSASRPEEQRGVWTVTGRAAVTERVAEFVGAAESEVVYMTVDSLLDDVVTDALDDASERGVTIRLGEMSSETEESVREAVPGAEPFESLWDWSATPAGRLLMVDGERTLVGVLVPPPDDAPESAREETAIWGAGPANGLVVVLRTMFTWQLERTAE